VPGVGAVCKNCVRNTAREQPLPVCDSCSERMP